MSDVTKEFGEVEVTETVEVPTQDGRASKTDTRVWHLNDGTECSRSAFIKEKYMEDKMSKREISEQFEIDYRAVYGATINMDNGVDSPGRASASTKYMVTEDYQVMTEHTDQETGQVVKLYNGEELQPGEAEPALKAMSRADYIHGALQAGYTRKEIAENLGVSYGVVYAATKDEETAGRTKHMVEYEGKTISRNEYIRILFSQGKTRAEIAAELDVEYSVVWQATKVVKSVADKFADLVAAIKDLVKFAVDEKKFTKAMEALDKIEIANPEAEDVSNTSADVTE